MFADGNRQLLGRIEALKLPADSRAALKVYLSAYLSFALEDPARCELLFQRHIPLHAVASVVRARRGRPRRPDQADARSGGHRPGDIDCIVAMTAGLMDAQVANDPTGDRWIRHLDRLVDLLVDDAHTRRS